jgi:hypothetical protein
MKMRVPRLAPALLSVLLAPACLLAAVQPASADDPGSETVIRAPDRPGTDPTGEAEDPSCRRGDRRVEARSPEPDECNPTWIPCALDPTGTVRITWGQLKTRYVPGRN